MMLTCSECNMEVTQHEGGVIECSCQHTNAGITASLSATCYGEGHADEKGGLRAAFVRLFDKLWGARA